MKIKTAFLLLASSYALHAGTEGSVPVELPWYLSIGTGYAWSQNAGISNPDPIFWDFALQGYDAKLDNRGFYSFAIGKQVHPYIDVNLSYINPENFNYVKYQTGVSSTPGFSGGSRVRYFTLDNRALLVNAFLRPMEGYSVQSIGIKPFVGAGIGYARNKVSDFHTIGQVTVGGTAVGSTTSISIHDSNKNAFAWQGSAGLSFTPSINHASVDVGYRYYDGGSFTGPERIFTQTSGFIDGKAWSGHLRTNQIFVDFKYTA